MRGSGLTPTGKRTLPTDGNAAGLTAEVLKYFQELEQSKKDLLIHLPHPQKKMINIIQIYPPKRKLK